MAIWFSKKLLNDVHPSIMKSGDGMIDIYVSVGDAPAGRWRVVEILDDSVIAVYDGPIP
jgi:hypothetical protein